MNAAGDAAVAWVETADDDATYRVRAALRPAGEPFEPALTLASGLPSPTPLPDVAIDATGEATIVWGDGTAIRHATMSVDGAGSTGTVAAPVGPTQPQVGMSDAGETIVVWRGGDARIYGARRPTTSDPFAAWPTAISGAGATAPRIATAPSGATAVTWLAAGSMIPFVRVYAATRTPGDDFGAPTAVSPDGELASAPTLAIAGTGASLIGWTAEFTDVRAVAGTPGDPSGPVETLSSGATITTTATAADGAGNGLVAFVDQLDGSPEVVVAGYDAAPPTIDALHVPAEGVAGTSIAMSVDAFDAWGWTASWDFGDGETATGATVEHAFAPGEHDVRVTVTDPAGQTAEAGPVTVRVAPPPSPAPPRVVTGEATDVAATAARLRGRVAAGSAPAEWWFEIGPTDADASRTETRVEPAGGAQVVAADVGGLEPGTTYRYRLVARGPGGLAAGEDRTFTTAVAPAPIADLPPALAPPASVPAKPAALRVRLVRRRDGRVAAVCASPARRLVACRVRVLRARDGTLLARGSAQPRPARRRVVVSLALPARTGAAVRLRATGRLRGGQVLRARADARVP